MAATAKKLFSATQLTNAAATYYTAPTSTRTIIKKLVFTNNDSSARTVTVYLVPLAGSASTSNMLINAKAIGIGETWECFEAEGMVLGAGDFLQALASANTAITIMASGVELT